MANVVCDLHLFITMMKSAKYTSVKTYNNDLCEPSHNGLLDDFLQPQKSTRSDFAAVYSIGVKLVALCEPSQNGWLLLLPQAHHKYVLPSSTSVG